MLKKSISTIILIVSILLVAACQHSNEQSLEGQPEDQNSALPLSSNNTLDKTLQDQDQQLKEIHPQDYNPPGFGVPQEEPAKQPALEQQLTTDMDQTVESIKFHLPFQDFQDRWNAVSTEQNSNLQITSLKMFSSEDGPYYQCLFDRHLELRVFTANQFVQNIQMVNNSSSSTDLLDMLTGWSHIVMMLNPDIHYHEVDQLFHDLGVGPNLDLNDVKEKTILFSGVQYTVKPTKSGFLFQAAYPDN